MDNVVSFVFEFFKFEKLFGANKRINAWFFHRNESERIGHLVSTIKRVIYWFIVVSLIETREREIYIYIGAFRKISKNNIIHRCAKSPINRNQNFRSMQSLHQTRLLSQWTIYKTRGLLTYWSSILHSCRNETITESKIFDKSVHYWSGAEKSNDTFFFPRANIARVMIQNVMENFAFFLQ